VSELSIADRKGLVRERYRQCDNVWEEQIAGGPRFRERSGDLCGVLGPSATVGQTQTLAAFLEEQNV